MKVIEKTKDGIWYDSSDGAECFLTKEEVGMMLEMLEPREKTNDR